MADFPQNFNLRTPVKVTDKLLIHNIDTGVTEYTTVQKLIDTIGYHSGTKYWTCAGIHFDAENPNSDDVLKYRAGYFKVQAGNIRVIAAVSLPDGAIITKAKVYGNAAAEDSTWNLYRLTLSDKTQTGMAGAFINTEDTSILFATIDNSLYAYFLYASFMVTDDEIYGARITYTI